MSETAERIAERILAMEVDASLSDWEFVKRVAVEAQMLARAVLAGPDRSSTT